MKRPRNVKPIKPPELPPLLWLQRVVWTSFQRIARIAPHRFLWMAFFVFWTSWLLFETRSYQEKAEVLRGELEINQLFRSKIQKEEEHVEDALTKASPWLDWIHLHDFWPEVISDLQSSIPSSWIWVTKLEPRSSNQLNTTFRELSQGAVMDCIYIRGAWVNTKSQDAQKSLQDFAKNILQLSWCGADSKDPSRIILSQDYPDPNSSWTSEFELLIPLKPHRRFTL